MWFELRQAAFPSPGRFGIVFFLHSRQMFVPFRTSES